MSPTSDAPSPILTPAPQAPGTSITSFPPTSTPTSGPHVRSGGTLLTTPSAHPLDWFGYAPLLALCLVLTLIVLLQLAWMLYAWRTASASVETRTLRTPSLRRHVFTVLVPSFHGASRLIRTLDALERQTHPDFEVRVIVDGHDAEAVVEARAAASRFRMRITVVVDNAIPLTRPVALNRALEASHGDIIGVFDAGDEPHRELLSRIDARFAETDVAIVQGATQPRRMERTWWTLCSAVDQYFWFRSRLQLSANAHTALLNTTAVFARAEWLYWSNGWDARTLTEGAELGVRVSAAGGRVAVGNGAGVLTRTELPASLRLWLAQRTAHDQGVLQVLGGGGAHLPRRRSRMFARLLMTMPFIEVLAGVLIPVVIIAALIGHLPSAVTLLTLVPLAPVLVMIVTEAVGLLDLAEQQSGARGQKAKVRVRNVARLALGWFPFRFLLLLSASRALVRQLLGFGVRGARRADERSAGRDAAPAAPLMVGVRR